MLTNSNHITANPSVPRRNAPAADSTTKSEQAYSQQNGCVLKPNHPSVPQRNSPAAGSTTKPEQTYSQQNGCVLISNHVTAKHSGLQPNPLVAGSTSKQQRNFNTIQSTPYQSRVLSQILIDSGLPVPSTQTEVNTNNVLQKSSTVAVAPTAKATIPALMFGTPTIMRDPHSNRTFKFNYAGSTSKRDSVELNSNNEILKSLLSNGETTSAFLQTTSTTQKEAVKKNVKSLKEQTSVKPKKSNGSMYSQTKSITEPTSSASTALNLVKIAASTTCALNLVKTEENSSFALNLVKAEVGSTCADNAARNGQPKTESTDGSTATKEAKVKISTTAVAWDGKAESSGFPEEAKQEYQRIKKNADMQLTSGNLWMFCGFVVLLGSNICVMMWSVAVRPGDSSHVAQPFKW